MMMKTGKIGSKKALEVILSRIAGFPSAKVRIEQYMTPSSIAAEILWFGALKDHIEGKVILDLGCGTGILGIGAALLGAQKVIFVDSDSSALDIARKNYARVKSEIYTPGDTLFLHADINDVGPFKENIDLVLQNPPFGVKDKHADKIFLEKAFSLADRMYTFHKSESKQFISAISSDHNFKINHYFEFDYPLKQTMVFHSKRIHYITVGCWLLEREKTKRNLK